MIDEGAGYTGPWIFRPLVTLYALKSYLKFLIMSNTAFDAQRTMDLH